MSANQSYLTGLPGSYDFIVATTLESINATMFEFLKETNASVTPFPVTSKYYWLDSSNQTVEVSLDTLKTTAVSSSNPSGTNNVDPATVASWTNGTMPADVSAIANSSFQYGFVAQIGIPPGFVMPGAPNPEGKPVLPMMVEFDQASMSVIFNLYCSQFQVFWTTWERGLVSYNNQSQPAGTAWFMQTTIPINQVMSNDNLPAAVQQQLNNLGPDAFSVQQLLFDLDHPSAVNPASINFAGIPPGSDIQTALSQVFASLYCGNLQGGPALGYTILPNENPSVASLGLGGMNLSVSPYNPPQPGLNRLSTLNYLCSQWKYTPPVTAIPWNWIDTAASGNQYDGVIAINRNTLAGYLINQLMGYTYPVCYNASVSVNCSDFLCTSVDYSWQLDPNQSPNVVLQPGGDAVLTISYSSSAHDQAGVDGDMGGMRLSPSYNLAMSFAGNQIIITQNLVIYCWISFDSSSASGNVVDITITDTYTLSVSENGRLAVTQSTNTLNNSQTPGVDGFLNFFTGLNSLTSDVAGWAQSLAGTSLQSIPVSMLDGFIFPGGKTFTYSDVSFSEYQDLVSHITYVDPA
jgi:hypothetical protein